MSTKNNKVNNEIDTIIKMYQKGLSLKAISDIYECCPNTIKKKLLQNGVRMRSRAGFKPEWNENYFETIDTEFKAYFLGFLMTDGNVSKRDDSSPCIRLQIQTSDKYILEILKSELNTQNKIELNVRKNSSMSELRVHSDIMFKHLNEYGVIPRKTGFEQFPKEKIPYNLQKHFIRGAFDGDGWVTLTKHGINAKKRLNVGFCGNYKFMTDIRDYLSQELNLYKVNVLERQSVSQIIFSSFHDVKMLYNYFYKDSTIHLTRKKDKFDLYYANTELTEINGSVTHRN